MGTQAIETHEAKRKERCEGISIQGEESRSARALLEFEFHSKFKI